MLFAADVLKSFITYRIANFKTIVLETSNAWLFLHKSKSNLGLFSNSDAIHFYPYMMMHLPTNLFVFLWIFPTCLAGEESVRVEEVGFFSLLN